MKVKITQKEVKKFESRVLKELKQLYAYDKATKVIISRPAHIGSECILMTLKVNTDILFTDELTHLKENSVLNEVLQYIITKDASISFNMCERIIDVKKILQRE